MTAAATKVKKITVTFNKAVDTTTTKLVVKKGVANPTVASTTFAADGKSAEIVMGTKLNEGTYTVEATVGEETLTADIPVKDETLTSYALVSPNLVASADNTTIATISYKALNQYDEMMVADAPQVTCTFGSTASADKGAVTACSADKSGTITVGNINTALTVPGTTGTIVLVDGKKGVNLQTSVTYQSKAFAASATVYGLYDLKHEKLVDGNIKTGAKVADYAILMSVNDQYDGAMTPEAIGKSGFDFSFTAAPVLTDLTVTYNKIDKTSFNSFKEMTYDGKSAFLVPVTVPSASKGKITQAGSLALTIVSGGKGMLANPTFTVDKAVVIKSLSVAPASTVYANEDNKIVVEAYDPSGNAITKYDDLSTIIATSSAQNGAKPGQDAPLTWKKNADGTGTLYFKPNSYTGSQTDNDKESTIGTIIFKANDPTSTDYMVKTLNVTYYENRYVKTVAGKGDKTITACAKNDTLSLDLTTLLFEDQYGNTIKADDKTVKVSTPAVQVAISKNDAFTKNDTTKTSFTKVTDVKDCIQGNKLILAAAQKGDATLYFRYGTNVKADDEKYDVKIAISATEVNDLSASDLKLVVNKGNAINVTKDAVTVSQFKTTTTDVTNCGENGNKIAYVYVTGVINGKTVVIPNSQYTVITDSIGALGEAKKEADKKTETKTITVVVDSESGAQTLTADVTVSNVDPTITTLKEKAADVTISGSANNQLKKADLITAFKVLDQYGNEMSDKEGDFTYKVELTGSYDKENVEIKHPSTQAIEVTFKVAGTYTGEITATTKDGKIAFTKAVTFKIS